jgi:large subunit ribosomal protein L21
VVTYAVVETGGKQYQVRQGDLIDVEKVPQEVGSTVELDQVLLLSREGQVTAGRPLVPGARVLAQVEEQLRGPKIIVFKYKAKTHYRKKQGHRQSYTRLRILNIAAPEGP